MTTFLKRLFSTLALLGLFAAIIFAPSPWKQTVFTLAAAILSFLLTREICTFASRIGMPTVSQNVLSFLCGFIVMFVCAFCFLLYHAGKLVPVMFMFILAVSYIFIFLILSAILFSGNAADRIRMLFSSLAVTVFVLAGSGMIVYLYLLEIRNMKYVFLFFILMTKVGDIGAYFIGTLSNKLLRNGNHKLVPSISPGKSWEGAAGGLLGTCMLALGFYCWMPHLVPEWWMAVYLGIMFFIGGLAGDLAESVLKRAAKVKDSGHIFPGIGGVFDLVDSLLVTAPLYILFLWSWSLLLAFHAAPA